MASGYPKKLNAFQVERAPQFVSDGSIENSIDEMIQSGELPTASKHKNVGSGLIKYTQRNFENEKYSETLWFDAATEQYKFTRQYKDGRNALSIKGTLQEISDIRQAENDSLEQEAYEAANPVPVSEKEVAVEQWFRNYKFGQEAYAYLSILPESSGYKFKNAIWAKFDHLFGKAAKTADLINQSYVAVWDEGKLDSFMAEADKLWAEEATQARIAESARIATPISPTPSGNLPQESQNRKIQDAINRKKPLAELRHEALFVENGERIPSTGTVRR